MNTLSFLAAMTGMVCMNVFVYFSWPKEWRRNPAVNAFLVSLHVLAAMNLILIFGFYRYLPEFIKPLVSGAGAIFYILDMDLAILFGIRFVIRFLKKRIKGTTETPARETTPFYRTETGQSALFLALASALALTGFLHCTPLHRAEYDIAISKPAGRESLKAVLIADIHAGAATWKKTYADLRKMILEEDPDLLLIGGDMFDETTSEADVSRVRAVLEDLRPPLGIYYVYGNHDESRDDWAAEVMRSMGVRVLEDEMTEIEGIQLVGRLDPKENNMGIGELFEALPVNEAKPLIVLQHRPAQLRKLSEQGVDLVLAGHTHGFNIPQFIPVGLFSDMYHGIRRYGNMTAVVTSGVSAWGFHSKFPAESEIAVLQITFEKS